MPRYVRVASLMFLVVLLTSPAAARAAKMDPLERARNDLSYRQGEVQQTLSDLILTLATRPGVTDPADLREMNPAVKVAGGAMLSGMAEEYNSGQLALFARDLQVGIDEFRVSYPNVELTPSATAARVQIAESLYRNLFAASENAGISLEVLERAFLRGCAAFKTRLSGPSARSLSLEDLEVVDLMLISAWHQIQVRSFFKVFPSALDVISPVPNPVWPAGWEKLLSYADDHLKYHLSSLESLLADPIALSDSSFLTQYQFNQEAMADLFSLKVAMELLWGGQEGDLQSLAERMDTIGGVMAGMTVEKIIESGLFKRLDGDYGSYSLIPLNEIAIYDWIMPGMEVSYRPLGRLAENLLQLGQESPVAPDYSYFSGPYLPVFQLRYDFELCDAIFKAERNMMDDHAFNVEMRSLSLEERYTLLQADFERRMKVLRGLQGVSDEEKRAIRILLSSQSFWML